MGADYRAPTSRPKSKQLSDRNNSPGDSLGRSLGARESNDETKGQNLRPAPATQNARAGPSKRESFTPEELDCVISWLSQFHYWDWIYAPLPTGKEKTAWRTEKRYPLDADSLLEKWSCPEQLIGVRFPGGWEGKTCYFMLDIDFGSQYHFRHGEGQLQKLLGLLEELGLYRHLKLRSSDSQGIHLYFPLPEAISTYWIGVTVHSKLQSAGFQIANGQLELFPNVRSAGKTLFKAHRLPLQVGSYVLNDDWQPVHSDIRQIIPAWEWAVAGQDLELLNEAIASTSKPFKKKIGKLPQWKADIDALMERGWTGSGQTQKITKKLLQYARIFLCMEWDEAETWAIEKVPTLPGFTTYSNHQKNYPSIIRGWTKTNQKSNKYQPYTDFLRTVIKERKAPSNDEKQAIAERNIRAAAQELRQQGLLTGTVRHCQDLMRETAGCGTRPLWRLKELWHPHHQKPGCVTAQPVRDSAIPAMEEKITDLAETLAPSTVTHPALLSVPKPKGKDLETQQEEQKPPKGELLIPAAEGEVERSPVPPPAQKPEPQPVESPEPAIARNSIVRRKSDGTDGPTFRVSQVEAGGVAWLKWQGQMVTLVAFPCAVEELERVA